MSEKFTPFDILAFAKAGWKPADVKEVIALSEAEPAADEQAAPVEDTQQQPATENAPEMPAQTEDAVPDYKAMYEDQQKQIDALKSDLSKAQSLNITANAAPNTPKITGQEAVNQIFREVTF